MRRLRALNRVATQLMRDDHVGSPVVVDETGAGRLVEGLLTDRDIVRSGLAMEVDPACLVDEDVMSRDVVTALEGDSVSDLLRRMRRKGLRRLPVVTPVGALVGLVTLDDLLSLMAEQLRELSASLTSIKPACGGVPSMDRCPHVN